MGTGSGAAEEAGFSRGSSELVFGLPFLHYIVASIRWLWTRMHVRYAVLMWPHPSMETETLNPETLWNGKRNDVVKVGMMVESGTY